MNYKNIIHMFNDIFYDINEKQFVRSQNIRMLKGSYVQSDDSRIPNYGKVYYTSTDTSIVYEIDNPNTNNVYGYRDSTNIKINNLMPYSDSGMIKIMHVPSLLNLKTIILNDGLVNSDRTKYTNEELKQLDNIIKMLIKIADNIEIRIANSQQDSFIFNYKYNASSSTSYYINDSKIKEFTIDNKIKQINNCPLLLTKNNGEYFITITNDADILELNNSTEANRLEDVLYFICKNNNIDTIDIITPKNIKDKKEEILVQKIPLQPIDNSAIITPTINNKDAINEIKAKLQVGETND